MCGRYAFYSPHEAVLEYFGVAAPPIEARYNIAPTQYVATLRGNETGQRSIAMLRWGLVPFWAKDLSIGNRMINARAETLDSKPAFKRALRKRRCLILANGFYEWKREANGKTPYFISLRDQRPFAMAGLWERWRRDDADPVESCTIVTTEPNDLVATLHNRMPVILDSGHQDGWLDQDNADPARLKTLLGSYPSGEMIAWPVSRTVNNPRNEGEELLLETI